LLHQKQIIIISDSTGRTANRMLEVTLSLFEAPSVEIDEQYSYITAVEQVEQAVQEAAEINALVVFTLVVPKLREALLEGCRQNGLQYIDLIEPVLVHISRWIQQEPIREPSSRPRTPQVDYFQRTMALDFALRHDDGVNVDGLSFADVVLVGVSRTSKTPLSIFLADRHGFRTGNIPIVHGLQLPEILFELPANRVFGLYVNPDRLMTLRQQRQRYHVVRGNYADPVHIRKEVQYARTLYAKHGWRQIDMTDRSIEEAASDIARYLNKQI